MRRFTLPLAATGFALLLTGLTVRGQSGGGPWELCGPRSEHCPAVGCGATAAGTEINGVPALRYSQGQPSMLGDCDSVPFEATCPTPATECTIIYYSDEECKMPIQGHIHYFYKCK
jgi:hypothetical protein